MQWEYSEKLGLILLAIEDNPIPPHVPHNQDLSNYAQQNLQGQPHI